MLRDRGSQLVENRFNAQRVPVLEADQEKLVSFFLSFFGGSLGSTSPLFDLDLFSNLFFFDPRQ